MPLKINSHTLKKLSRKLHKFIIKTTSYIKDSVSYNETLPSACRITPEKQNSGTRVAQNLTGTRLDFARIQATQQNNTNKKLIINKLQNITKHLNVQKTKHNCLL